MEKMQDMRIRSVPVALVRKLKSALAAEGVTLIEWFVMAAAATADSHGKPTLYTKERGQRMLRQYKDSGSDVVR